MAVMCNWPPVVELPVSACVCPTVPIESVVMNSGSKAVPIVEDDEAIAAGLALNLTIEGYQPTCLQDGLAALEYIRQSPPALVVLDIGLPHKNGLEILSDLRAEGNRTPVVMLSARQDEFDKVAALRLGADDYV